MPNSVPDSDDEDGEDLTLSAATEENTPKVNSGSVNNGNGGIGKPLSDEPSTRSTDRLHHQIHTAEAGLFTQQASAPAKKEGTTFSVPGPSPSFRPRPRGEAAASHHRHALPPTSFNQAFGRNNKATTTMKTYSKRSSGAPMNAGNAEDEGKVFAAFRDDRENENGNINYGTQGEGIEISDHSAPASQTQPATQDQMMAMVHAVSDEMEAQAQVEGIAAEGMVDFMLHEPNVLFRDSGSTVVDGEASQARLVELALEGKRGGGVGGIMEEESQDKSSSFPWSTQQAQTQAQKAAESQDLEVTPRGQMQAGLLKAVESQDAVDEQVNEPENLESADRQTDGHPNEADHKMLAQEDEDGLATFKKKPSSPIVQVIIPKKATPTPAKEPPTAVQASATSAKGRKRKAVEERAENPSSEDFIGLPKEQYKPRPSSRRATIVTEPVDYSVVPGKTKKTKRRKTEPFAAGSPDFGGSVVSAASPKTELTDSKSQIGTEATGNDDTAAKPNETPDTKKQQSASPEMKEEKPSTKSKPPSKVKRRNTTIYEDHVDLVSPNKSHSLSQQQAERISTLQDVPNESLPSVKRKRTRVIDSDDEEDELAGDTPVEKEDPPADREEDKDKRVASPEPKKRGKGRPRKSDVENKAVDETAQDGDKPTEPAPTKKKRGRPAKAAKVAEADLVPTDADDDDPKEQAAEEDPIELPQENKPLPKERDEEFKKSPTTTQEPTPSPEKPAKTAAPPPAPPKASPAPQSSMSALSSSAKHRVGLSRSHRIPSLLKIMKPAPKK